MNCSTVSPRITHRLLSTLLLFWNSHESRLTAVIAGVLLSGTAMSAPQHEITGTLALPVATQTLSVGPSRSVALPYARVALREPAANAVVSEAKTTLNGRFRLVAEPGVYTLCWETQGVKGCAQRVVVQEDNVYLKTVHIKPDAIQVVGRVVTGDGRACWLHDSFFGINMETEVSLRNESTGLQWGQSIRANTQGDYAFLGVAAGRYIVVARCEKSDAKIRVSVRGATNVAPLIQFANRAPRITGVSAEQNGRAIARAIPGSSVALAATHRDPDGDSIEYLWRSADGAALVNANSTSIQSWTPPARAGLHSMYLLARDGKGGYAYKRVDVSSTDDKVLVSGYVINETTKLPIAKAAVALNGTRAVTNAQGWFSVSTNVNPEARYVLGIDHQGYAHLSRIFDRDASGNTFEMVSTQVTQHDPNLDIILTDKESSGPCGSLAGKQPPRLQRLVPRLLIDEKRADVARSGPTPPSSVVQPKDEACRHQGATLSIKAGSLIRADGSKPSGLVRASVATLNPSRRALPGDYQATDKNGKRTELLSFGAVYAEFRDAGGEVLNLRNGTRAELVVPVPASQRVSATPTIAMWSYVESKGVWIEEAKASLQQTATGPAYVGTTTHFSTINMDVAGNDPAVATCVRLELDASFSAWQNKVLRAYVSYAGNAVQVKETALDNAQYHAIYRIPFGTAFPPNTLRLELRGTFNGQQVVLLDNIINTDLRPKMTGTDLWPPYPYDPCGVPIVLTAALGIVPQYGDNDATGRPYFLTGPFGDFAPANGDQAATDYYTAIDPGSQKTTLGAWWTANGFNSVDGSGGTRAAYLNHNDLGFGRDMNCLKTGLNLACYVTNYGAADQNPANADFARDKTVAKRGATVAMEFNAGAGAEAVQFYVYGNTGATSGRLKFADLDGFGPKPVPFLCMVCHGGPSLLTNNKAQQSRFREFDLPSFKYPNGASWDYGQGVPPEVDAVAFGQLNQLVRDISPINSPIRELINHWYPGAFANPPVTPTPPGTWNSNATNQTAYQEVYGKTCRTCHVARDKGASTPPFLTFNDASNFQGGTSFAVCGFPKYMPNAVVTYKNFWSDLTRVNLFKSFTSTPLCQ